MTRSMSRTTPQKMQHQFGSASSKGRRERALTIIESDWTGLASDPDFSHSQGDLDMVLWDKNNDRAVLDENGAAIKSNSSTDQEVIEFEGSAS